MLNGLDLFSGIGGITLALKSVVKPIAYCENNRYAQSVLLSRMASGELPKAPIWDDIRTLNLGKFGSAGNIDIIYGGFPCQDISVAGTRKGLEGSRSGLFFEALRLVKEIRPRFIFLENVPRIRTSGAYRIVKELARLGYDCSWDIVSAAEVGAPHLRKRWFLFAYSHSHSIRQQSIKQSGSSSKNVSSVNGEKKYLADSEREGPQRLRDKFGLQKDCSEREISGKGWWSIEPDVDRVAHGIPFRVDRITGLGNAVVPEQIKKAWLILTGQKPK